jgi:hypothetical protein
MRKLMNRKIIEQNLTCSICSEEFTNYNDVVPDHKEPKGMGERGGTIIRTISKQHIGGAMKKKDQPEWMTDSTTLAFVGKSFCQSTKFIFGREAFRAPSFP